MKLVLFDFDIKYRAGKLNQAVDALGHHPTSNEDSSSDVKSEEYETISYVIVSDDLTNIAKRLNYP